MDIGRLFCDSVGDVGRIEEGETGAVPSLSVEGFLALFAGHFLCNLQCCD
jgi:hypothetical protein